MGKTIDMEIHLSEKELRDIIQNTKDWVLGELEEYLDKMDTSAGKTVIRYLPDFEETILIKEPIELILTPPTEDK